MFFSLYFHRESRSNILHRSNTAQISLKPEHLMLVRHSADIRGDWLLVPQSGLAISFLHPGQLGLN